ncbi:MAG TPA: YdeI/OmpD-associated family protein, partial [Vicinamibacterales bacterium]
RIDDDRYARKFTPRKLESNWSSINIKRYNELKAAKKLAAPGLARSPEGRPVVDMARPDKVPAYIETALKQNARAWKFFESLAPSHRRMYLAWIDSAKRDVTKQTRLQQAVKMLSAGRKPGLG